MLPPPLGMNKIPKCFSCLGGSKELSTKTKRSTYNLNQARTKPWLTRPLTFDNNSPIMKRIRTNDTPKCFSNRGDCSGLSKEARRWNSRNQGSSQLSCTHSAISHISPPASPSVIYKITELVPLKWWLPS